MNGLIMGFTEIYTDEQTGESWQIVPGKYQIFPGRPGWDEDGMNIRLVGGDWNMNG